jgi:4-hydroxy-tetrahydrodipicolinate reductase
MSNQQPIRVAVSGACGRMGREVVKLVIGADHLELVAAIDSKSGEDIGQVVGLGVCGIITRDDLGQALTDAKAQVVVDFTTPHSVMNNVRTAIACGVRPVVGTTGFSPDNIKELDNLCKEKGIGGIIAPNFSIGAILMMKFAAQASKYFPNLEIIEFHGDQKLDAPSGTAVKTAEMISEIREELKQGNPNETETIEGSRGGYFDGFRIHSVRLPGIFAQQEVVMGGFGQTLKIRHDSYDRACYMPGVDVAIQRVLDLEGITYGFESFI